MNSKFSALGWVLYISRRFSKVDRTGRSRVTTFLASLGICFGVMTLITVISVMNGFQRSFIDSIMEISSYHVRVKTTAGKDSASEESLASFQSYCSSHEDILCATSFYEAQALMVGERQKQAASLIRAVSPDILFEDAGFRKEMNVYAGSFDLSQPASIVLGSELARRLGVRVGKTVNLFALSGGNDVDLLSEERLFTVTGVFHCGYAEINASYAFISLDDGKKYFGSSSPLYYGLKLTNSALDSPVIKKLTRSFPDFQVQSWKDYNRSFFGALRVEKNMLMLLVFLIFVVVGINIFNGMRRLVYERREEISVLSAFGARPKYIQWIFIMQGFLTGLSGAVPGLALGLLLSVRMETIFTFMSKLVYYAQYFFAMLFNPEYAQLITENPMYLLYAHIPPRIFPGEVLAITIFGIFSSLIASWIASRGVLKLTVAEVLRDE